MAQRYFLDPLPTSGLVALDRSVSRHLRCVVRCRAGDEVRLFDGHGSEARARIVEVARRELRVEILERRPATVEPMRALELAFSAPRGDRLAEVLVHGTELGVVAFHLILTERSPPHAARQSERDERLLVAATAQSGRAHVPTLAPPTELDAFLRTRPGELREHGGECWVAARGEDCLVPASRAASSLPPALVLVGPEGGFTEAEEDRILALGFAGLDLGPLTLRAETAALCALSVLGRMPPRWPRSVPPGR